MYIIIHPYDRWNDRQKGQAMILQIIFVSVMFIDVTRSLKQFKILWISVDKKYNAQLDND